MTSFAAPSNPVPDWLQVVTAAATPVGAVITLTAVGIALYVALVDRSRFKKQDASRRREQARLIRLTRGMTDSQCVVVVTNHSQLPVFDVKIENPVHPDPAVTTRPLDHEEVATISALNSDHDHKIIFGLFIDGMKKRDRDKYPESSVRCKFRFTDANGVYWSVKDSEDPVEILKEGPVA